jgi:hypothetical protein
MFTILKQLCRGFLRSAWLAALSLFGPRGGFLPPDEPVLNGFGIAQRTAGVLTLLAVNTAYSSRLDGVTGLPLMPPSLADPLAVLSVPVVMVLLSAAALCFTRRDCRRRAARQLVYPVQASILFIVVLIAGRWIVPLGSYQGPGTATALEPLAVLAVIWYLAFAVCAAWCCAAGLFRAADGHPLLAPSAAVVLSWLAAIRVLSTDALPAGMPHPLYFTVVLGGPATVTVLSAFEVWHLRDKYPGKFPFREGPLPGSRRAEAPWAGVPFKDFLHDQLTKFHEQLRDVLRLLRSAQEPRVKGRCERRQPLAAHEPGYIRPDVAAGAGDGPRDRRSPRDQLCVRAPHPGCQFCHRVRVHPDHRQVRPGSPRRRRADRSPPAAPVRQPHRPRRELPVQGNSLADDLASLGVKPGQRLQQRRRDPVPVSMPARSAFPFHVLSLQSRPPTLSAWPGQL